MRKALGIILFFLFSLMAFGDIIYLSDGTKLSGKILSYLGDEVEVLLETGSSLRLKTNQIIRIEPLDTVLLSTSNASMESNSAPITTVPGQWGQGYSVTGVPEATGYIPATEIPVMFGDPETEMRKRLLMYSEMKKEPWVAAELSLLIPSAGHLYTGEWERGFLFLGAKAAFLGVAIFGFLPMDTGDTDEEGEAITRSNNTLLGAVGAGGFALFTLLEFVDSYYAAERYNQVLRLRLGIEQFDPMMLPTFSK
ncbi:MAG TPA: hypothetical protein PKM99_01925 [Thermotogota bacterium]|jgi:hypothetical protein|nr:hypothetical protein [Thermotogota bacterium]NLZ14791.1 hypothetical protein [Thermotogaceae bacterium]MDD8042103.1 hypothetical protein [Thermotogota bacterium]MDD8053812.1 hypothetical protein [Thermotogota bacterium]HNR62850.1 hypothetical protein [Thermotogota bacterium]